MKVRFAVMAALAAAVVAAAAEPPMPATGSAGDSVQAAAWVKDLGAEQWEVREAAQEKLTAMGPAVYRQLEGATAGADAETRARLETILRQINRADLEHPTPITLHLQNATPAEVFKEIARQADTQIGPADLIAGIQGRVTLDVDHEPFWKVVMDLCQRWHVSPAERMGIGVRTVTLEQGDPPAGRAEARMEGPFWVMPLSAVSGGAVANRTIVTFKLLVDPKFTVQRAATFIKVEKVADDQGKSLAYDASFSSDTFSASNNLVWTLVSHIRSPADWKVGEFKGTARIQVSQASVRWAIDNPLTAGKAARETAVGKCTLTGIEKMDPRNMRVLPLYDVYQVKLELDLSEEMVKQLAGGGRIMGGSVRVWDASGMESEPTQLGQGVPRNGHVDFSATVGARSGSGRLGGIVRMEWELPAGVKELTVPVEFKDFSVK
jgi:hypothetical protein